MYTCTIYTTYAINTCIYTTHTIYTTIYTIYTCSLLDNLSHTDESWGG